MIRRFFKRGQGHYQAVVAFVFGMIFGSLIVFLGATWINEAKTAENLAAEKTLSEVLPASKPTWLRIPKLELEVEFEGGLGVDEKGAVSVPKSYEKVGWYKYGPTPGERGPAVILGHVDSYLGPAVFFFLGQLEPGDEILVDREDGQTAVFAVVEKERIAQNHFPTGRVYGNLDYAGLRLITCTGVYNHGTLQYSHNLIVYAKLVRVEAKESAPSN